MRKSGLTQRRLSLSEMRFLEEALNSDYRNGNIRLREGEYQYDLAKAIASFELELYFPDVKDITKRLYGEAKTNDIQFIRKIQTILKKMEKSSIVLILPKKKPWDLQRYALSSFKFQDVEKNMVVLATEQQIRQVQEMSHSLSTQLGIPNARLQGRLKIFMLALCVTAFYVASLWTLLQPIVNPIVFIPAFSVAILCSLMLGKTLSRE